MTLVPLPGPGMMQPYHVAVDSKHNAWLNIWTSDVVLRYEPATSKWTTFVCRPAAPRLATFRCSKRTARCK
jgi:streptogramin lyase